jgi:hypothetical protein
MQRANQEYAAAVDRASASHSSLLPTHNRLSRPWQKNQTTEALHAQISETLRGILSDDEFAAEAPG